MFNREIVEEVLERTLSLDITRTRRCLNRTLDQDSTVSMLIHDIFGGEILKTHKGRGLHFYNRINGESIDFSNTGTENLNDDHKFEDIPATPGEASGYFDETDYLTFFMRFIRAFEEVVGLGLNSNGLPA